MLSTFNSEVPALQRNLRTQGGYLDPIDFVRVKHISRPGRRPLFSQQFRHRLQLLHMLRHYFHDDNDRNAEQYTPDSPEPRPK